MESNSHGANQSGRTYRVVLSDDRRGGARAMEFEGQGPASALLVVDQHCDGRLAEVIEDGRSLGCIRNHRNGGFWTVHAADTTPDW